MLQQFSVVFDELKTPCPLLIDLDHIFSIFQRVASDSGSGPFDRIIPQPSHDAAKAFRSPSRTEDAFAAGSLK